MDVTCTLLITMLLINGEAGVMPSACHVMGRSGDWCEHEQGGKVPVFAAQQIHEQFVSWRDEALSGHGNLLLHSMQPPLNPLSEELCHSSSPWLLRRCRTFLARPTRELVGGAAAQHRQPSDPQ